MVDKIEYNNKRTKTVKKNIILFQNQTFHAPVVKTYLNTNY